MHVEKGEEISGMWVSSHVPGIGVYKLMAKKRLDGVCEWVHFQQREDGSKKILFRGNVESEVRLTDVLETMNITLARVYGVSMRAAEFDAYTLDGKKFDGPAH